MATMTPARRPLSGSCWKALIRHSRQHKTATRSLSTYHQHKPASQYPLLPPQEGPHVLRRIKAYPPPPSLAAKFKEPMKDLAAEQISILDPTGARTLLFSKANPDSAKVGDILLVRQKTGDPFAGVCINIRRRGVDTGILLRNNLTRVGVEMWYKIYSPNVEGVEVVQRAKKRARRARLTFMRKPKHDLGSVQNILFAYQRAKMAKAGSTDSRQGAAPPRKAKKKAAKKGKN